MERFKPGGLMAGLLVVLALIVIAASSIGLAPSRFPLGDYPTSAWAAVTRMLGARSSASRELLARPAQLAVKCLWIEFMEFSLVGCSGLDRSFLRKTTGEDIMSIGALSPRTQP